LQTKSEGIIEMIADYFNSQKHDESLERIERAFNYQNKDFSEVPLILQTNSYWLTGHSPKEIPEGIFDNPEIMYDFQKKGIEEHLSNVDDDYIPYLMPWYGVGIVPNLFGCNIKFFKSDDPACVSYGVKTLEDIKKMKIPDFRENNLAIKVLETIKYFREKSTIPVGLTDMQSTLDCVTLIAGYENLFYWMKDEPDSVDFLIEIVNETLIEWVKLQKQVNGEKLNSANGLINVKPAEGIGIWYSDDDAVILSPDLFKRFMLKKYEKSFGTFGSGMVHWCGNANHQIEKYLNISPIRAVHNYILGNVDSAIPLQQELSRKKVCLVVGDIIPVEDELEGYLKQIKEKLNPEGLVLQFTIASSLGIKKGQYTVTDRNVLESAQRIIKFFRG
jgi:uroporphyrinogen-III decarboxylase